MTPRLRFPLALVLLLSVGSCAKRDAHDHGGGHVHRAPHGGHLVEIGQHAYNVELVRDAAAGKLSAYILDGHAENFVRIAAPSIEIVAIYGGEKRPLTLKAIANSATGETVGNTSQFDGEAEWLKKASEFPATIPALEIKGAKFTNIPLHFSTK